MPDAHPSSERLYPLTFAPIFKDRIWGGRTLERLYGKSLPSSVPIGESWEISDRPGDESRITNGPLAGRTLRWLMTHHGADVLGAAPAAAGGRFPILCKILDAREKLSLQVHPPPAAADALAGEPKTEMWYIADAEPDAMLYVGLRRGMTRAEFEQRIADGRVEECFHRIPVRAGDTMFLPSGRVHAIGAGLVIFEIQQNSDTTYRVYDWDRLGLDGRPRELHIPQSLASIDFTDFEPALVSAAAATVGALAIRPLVRHELFNADLLTATAADTVVFREATLRIAAVTAGRVRIDGNDQTVTLMPGQFCLIPASVSSMAITAHAGAALLLIDAGAPR